MEQIKIKKGTWWDEVYQMIRGKETLVKVTEKDHNLVVRSAGNLLASLLKNEPGIGGVQYHAQGEGMSGWDLSPVDEDFEQNALTAEVYRQAPTNLEWVDEFGAVSLTPTNTLQIRTELDFPVLAAGQYIREQGLFGGDATGAADSGIMIDVIHHTKIYKDSTVKLIRYIQLEF